MTKSIEIDGRTVQLRASAAIPRLYRIKFRRDILEDLREIAKAKKAAEEEDAPIPIKMLEAFENVAYLMAKHAEPSQVPQTTVEDWLDTFETFSIYDVFPVILELWDANMETMAIAKKK